MNDIVKKHCVKANCLFCNIGKYPDCKYIEDKQKAIAEMDKKNKGGK